MARGQRDARRDFARFGQKPFCPDRRGTERPLHTLTADYDFVDAAGFLGGQRLTFVPRPFDQLGSWTELISGIKIFAIEVLWARPSNSSSKENGMFVAVKGQVFDRYDLVEQGLFEVLNFQI